MSAKPFEVAARVRSFSHAIRGVAILLKEEHNAWIHGLATLATLGLAAFFRVSAGEWLALLLAMGLVWCAEAMNTAIEALCDRVSPEADPQIARAKDLAAGAVLVAAVAAFGVGCVVFWPRVSACCG